MECKTIKSTNGLYEASNTREIQRKKGLVRNNPNGGVRTVGGKPLSQKTKSNGYKEVNLFVDAQIGKSRYVHRLIAEAFIGDIQDGMCINHKDGDKSNNHISNLEIVTYSENSKHAYDTGLLKPNVMKGSKHPRSTVGEYDVLKIRHDYSIGITPKKLSQKYGMPKSTICKIVYRVTWSHI